MWCRDAGVVGSRLRSIFYAEWIGSFFRSNSGRDRLDESSSAQDVDHSLHVVGQNVKTHLRADFWNCFRQEVRITHPTFERAERMFCGRSAHTHALGFTLEASVQRLDHVLVLPAGDSPILAGRTTGFHRTFRAV